METETTTTEEPKKRGRKPGSKNKPKTPSGENGANVIDMPNRTEDLPGVEGVGVSPKRIPAVETAADAYAKARDRRMAMTEKEVEAKEELSRVMHEHAEEIGKHPETGELKYVYNGGDKDRRVVTLTPTDEKLKVKDVEAFEE